MKGITSDQWIASECVMKMCQAGNIQVINKSEPQQLKDYGAHFLIDPHSDQRQACNFAQFVALAEDLPLQVATIDSQLNKL